MKEERKRILKMVEEGKLKVEDALALLEDLEKAKQTMEQRQEEIVNELSAAVKFEEAKKGEHVSRKIHSTKEKIFEFVESALKKMKDFDIDLNFGQSVEISHIFHYGGVHLKDMDIDVANGSLKIAAWDHNDVRIECKAKVYRAESTEQARQNFLKEVIFAVEGQKLVFSTQQKWMKVEAVLFVPRTQYDRVRIRMFNGPINAEDLQGNEFRIKTANGKIYLARLNGGRSEIETANGHIKMEGSAFNELEAETLNGAIKLDGDFKRIEPRTFNGNIVCRLAGSRAEWFSAKATTGAIDLFVPEEMAVKGELKTNLGGFDVKLDGIQILEEKSEMIQKLLRFQSVYEAEHVLKINADTKTGSINIHKLAGTNK